MSASLRGQVEPFHVMEVVKAVAERQRTHGDAIALCVGTYLMLPTATVASESRLVSSPTTDLDLAEHSVRVLFDGIANPKPRP